MDDILSSLLYIASRLKRGVLHALRSYLRFAIKLSGGRLVSMKGVLVLLSTLLVMVLLLVGTCRVVRFGLDGLDALLADTFTDMKKHTEKPFHDPTLSDRRDPYRNYPRLFNDLNDLQLEAARTNGTSRPLTVEELESGDYGLLPIATNPLYKVDPLTHSAPYLVPRAKVFLDDLGRAFQDSLFNRGYDRRHRFIITSVYRTQDHITKLRRSGNVNASSNSCHQYGTTVDITRVRFDKPSENMANDIKLQQLLYQTVYDMQRTGRCYVKYERKQSCLHTTVR